ncbi:hypothetical protein NLI96_g8086 [Meripilus lineatus]|uniref:Amidohydrolase-related domain-containing protein n=1 Tax=Meripilus lineatus TaxID=2056292 RepID=A0AAD5UZV8_9APHY|nr:hypothetical protein NLI96_g8086 [Physisporinus lineatus]
MSLYPGAIEKTRDSLLPKLALKPWIRPEPQSLILRNAQVVDPALSSILPGRHDVKLCGGQIEWVVPSLSGRDAETDEVIRVVDLDGKYLCPDVTSRFHDGSGHWQVPPMSSGNPSDDHLVLTECRAKAELALSQTGWWSSLTCESTLLVLDNISSMFIGGHADFGPSRSSTGCCAGHSQSLGRTCDGVPQVLKATREELKAGADFIKIMCGGGVASPTDAIETVQFTAEEIQAITTTCRQMGGKQSMVETKVPQRRLHLISVVATAHAYTDAAVRHAISNGVQGIEHGNMISSETAEMLAANNISLTPTLSCYGIMVRPPFEDFLPPEGKIKNKQVMEQGLDALKIADAAGVNICYGSDLLTSMHALQTEEFTVRSSVLPHAKVLQHATVNAILDRPEDFLLGIIAGGRVITSKIAGMPSEASY